ncbi:MAG: Ferredoxin, 2Fe-2S [Pelotomaculum sp. PtaU1.Bin035]|nr:MAG: Ferredoxin, 2Fe-2S [Pelotomaculum sp. PtaU1.Bin035]
MTRSGDDKLNKPKYHVFVCTSSRVNGQQKGFCHTKSSVGIVSSFMEEIEGRGLGGEVAISNTGCFGLCERGPVVVVYPDNVWYGGVTDSDVEEIMDEHIEGGKAVKRLELSSS